MEMHAIRKIQFFIPMVPPTATKQQQRSAGGKRFYDSPKLADARAKLTAHLAQFRPDKPAMGPVRVAIQWLFPLTADHWDGEYKTSKPDLDNMEKLILDIMTSLGFWQDDRFIVTKTTEKRYAEIPGIFVRIEEIQQENRQILPS